MVAVHVHVAEEVHEVLLVVWIEALHAIDWAEHHFEELGHGARNTYANCVQSNEIANQDEPSEREQLRVGKQICREPAMGPRRWGWWWQLTAGFHAAHLI